MLWSTGEQRQESRRYVHGSTSDSLDMKASGSRVDMQHIAAGLNRRGGDMVVAGYVSLCGSTQARVGKGEAQCRDGPK